MTTGADNVARPLGVDGRLTDYGDAGFARFLRRAFLASAGFDGEDLDRPVVGIAHTISDYVPCHRQMPEMVEAVKRGVLQAGGMPLAFPTMPLGEPLLSPTSMLFRNLASIEAEELIAAQPMDAVVLLGGCDKTVPAQLMAAVAADVPAIQCVVGPMLTSEWRGDRVGACTDCRRIWGEHRGGRLDAEEVDEARQALCTTSGTCMVMGTASTMACLTEALGLMLPGGATSPSPSGDRLRNCAASGRRAVELATGGLRPSAIVSADALHNAAVVLAAVGGSTNALVHLAAIAGRAGVELGPPELARAMDGVPLLVDCKPSGTRYLQDLDRAGGVPTLMKVLEPWLRLDALTVTGRSVRDNLAGVAEPQPWQDVIRTPDDPVGPPGSLRFLRGSLAPDGAVIKVSAASEHLLQHVGPALVFDGLEDLAARIDDEELDVTPDHVLVLRGIGPRGGGFPEAGSMAIPRRLALQGVRDVVRISDGRMSGTSYGTVVLHCAPESARGGPLAIVRDGDLVRLDVAGGRIDLLVEDGEVQRRLAAWTAPSPARRGWRRIYDESVLEGNAGGDLRPLTDDQPTPRTVLP